MPSPRLFGLGTGKQPAGPRPPRLDGEPKGRLTWLATVAHTLLADLFPPRRRG